MTLFALILVLVLLGVALWALGQFPTLDPTIAKLIRIVIVVVASVLVVYFLFELAVYLGLTDFRPARSPLR